jgi:2'-phosphotransferase
MARGGRGGGNRNPANQPRDVQVSRKISWLLRHGASQEGLKLGKGGYVNVQEAVSWLPLHFWGTLEHAH